MAHCYWQIKIILLTSLITLLSGCSAFVGHKESLDEYEQQLINTYCNFTNINSQITNDPLLWSLNGGALARNCLQYEKSITYFDQAEAIIKEQEEALELIGMGRSIDSILVNSNINDYQSQNYEKIMINIYKALNFLSLEDFDNARVEFHRALDRQRRAKEYFEDEILAATEKLEESQYAYSSDHMQAKSVVLQNYQGNLTPAVIYPDFVNPLATYLSAIFFYIEGDYDLASQCFKETRSMLPNHAQVKQDFQLANKADNSRQKPQQRYVWIVYENGLGMIRGSFYYSFPSFLFTDKIIATSINLPTIYQRAASYPYLAISKTKTTQVANMDSIIQLEFNKRLPAITAEAILNMIAKSAIQYTLEEELGDFGGKWIGFFYQLATDTTDIRHWRALPKDFQVSRVVIDGSPIQIYSPQGDMIANIDTLSPEHDAIIYIRSDKQNHNIIHVIQKQ